MRLWRTGARALAATAMAAGLFFSIMPATPVAAGGGATAVIRAAEAKIGDPWVYGATGPNAFDCAGLVYYAFRTTGNLAAIGGGYKNATALYTYFRARGRASTTGGRPGDLVVFGGGAHIGIYMGSGRVISTLLSGVRIASLWAIYPRFTAFLHTGLSGYAPTVAIRTSSTTRTTRKPAPVKVSVDLGTAVDSQTVFSEANLNMRARPTIMSPILGVVTEGSALTISRSTDGTGGTWYLIKTDAGKTGWVSGKYTTDPAPPIDYMVRPRPV